jgi:hypothetical protein
MIEPTLTIQQTKCRTPNLRFGAMSALPRRQFGGKLHVIPPQQVQWKPRLRQAAGTLAATRERALWKRQGDSNSIFREFIQFINLEVARHGFRDFKMTSNRRLEKKSELNVESVVNGVVEQNPSVTKTELKCVKGAGVKLKQFFYLFVVVAISFGFIGCDKNNGDNPNNPNNPDDPSNPTSSVLVSSILVGGSLAPNFTYDAQNRLSSIDFGYTVVPLTYPSANTVLAIFEGEEWVFTLNNDGHIVKIKYPDGYEDIYEYENGYLQTDGDANFIWENGNLKSVQWNGGGVTYSYNTISNKEANIAPWTTPMLIVGGHYEGFYAYFPAAYFGKSSKNLVSSSQRDGEQRNYYYETNVGGYVTKVYEDNTEGHPVCEIQYK